MDHHIILHEGMSERESNDKFAFMLKWGIIFLVGCGIVWFILSRFFPSLSFTSIALILAVLFFITMFVWWIFGGVIAWIYRKITHRRHGKHFLIGMGIVLLLVFGWRFLPTSSQQEGSNLATNNPSTNTPSINAPVENSPASILQNWRENKPSVEEVIQCIKDNFVTHPPYDITKNHCYNFDLSTFKTKCNVMEFDKQSESMGFYYYVYGSGTQNVLLSAGLQGNVNMAFIAEDEHTIGPISICS